MNPLPISRKVEKLLTMFLRSKFGGVLPNIYEGHEKAPVVNFPCLIIHTENARPHEEMPTSTGVRVVTVRFQMQADSEPEDGQASDPRIDLDGWRESLERFLADPCAITDFANATETPPDGRAIRGLHVYDIIAEEEASEMERTDWIEDMVFGVVCQPLDALS